MKLHAIYYYNVRHILIESAKLMKIMHILKYGNWHYNFIGKARQGKKVINYTSEPSTDQAPEFLGEILEHGMQPGI